MVRLITSPMKFRKHDIRGPRVDNGAKKDAIASLYDETIDLLL